MNSHPRKARVFNEMVSIESLPSKAHPLECPFSFVAHISGEDAEEVRAVHLVADEIVDYRRTKIAVLRKCGALLRIDEVERSRKPKAEWSAIVSAAMVAGSYRAAPKSRATA